MPKKLTFNFTLIYSTGEIYNRVHLVLGRPQQIYKNRCFYKLQASVFIKTNTFWIWLK